MENRIITDIHTDIFETLSYMKLNFKDNSEFSTNKYLVKPNSLPEVNALFAAWIE